MAVPVRVALVGATASGKSAVALEVARRLGDVELISVDSMQVYRRMDIGTAKPGAAERAAARHHCIDLVEPTVDFSVADFRAAVDRALASIASRGNRALFVGGTGLYHRLVIDRFDLPGEYPEVRAELAAVDATSELVERLARLDPAALDRIEPANRRRLIRALEVTIGSGRRFSDWGPGIDSYPPTEVAQVGIQWPRAVLAERIVARTRAMIAAGLVGEVAALHRTGLSRTAAQALGYKELIAHLEGEMSEDEAIASIITHTRQFAVRQERWFRRDPRVRWVAVDVDPVAEVTPTVLDCFEST